MQYQLVEYINPNEFCTIAIPFINQREIENNLPLSILSIIDTYQQVLTYIFYKDNTPLILALRTPPHNLCLCLGQIHPTEEEIESFVSSLLANNVTFPGIIGNKELVTSFNKFYCKKSHRVYIPTHEMTAMQANEKNFLNKSVGFARKANANEIHLLTCWQMEMVKECNLNGNYTYEILRDRTQKQLDYFYVWEDNQEAVSMLLGLPRGIGMGVSCVYTPTKLRKKGYCTSLVAEFTNFGLLKYPYCVLNVDDFNPVSNHIYLKIGYKPIAKILEGSYLSR